jgi:flagellar basal body-associated protein FliL
MTKMIVVSVLVTVVILTECLLAYFMIPSTADVEAWAKGVHGKAATDSGHGGHGEHGEHAASTTHSGHGEAEVDLGKFNVVVHEPASQITLRVNFHLIGTVPEEEHTEFEHLLEKHQHRLRDHTIFEIRNSKIEDLTDPGLALLKRRILAKSNDLLGKPLLRSVVFSDFSFVEQ